MYNTTIIIMLLLFLILTGCDDPNYIKGVDITRGQELCAVHEGTTSLSSHPLTRNRIEITAYCKDGSRVSKIFKEEF